MYTRVVLAEENQSKQHGGQRGGNFAASKFISSFSPKATIPQLLAFLLLSLKSLLLRLQTHSYRATSSINSSLVTLPCSIPAMFKTNALCYKRTFGLCGLEALNHGSELRILWDTFRSQIAEFWFPYDRRIANDRRRSQTIAEVCFHMIADDRRTFCDLRSAICDLRSSAIIWKPALRVFFPVRFRIFVASVHRHYSPPIEICLRWHALTISTSSA